MWYIYIYYLDIQAEIHPGTSRSIVAGSWGRTSGVQHLGQVLATWAQQSALFSLSLRSQRASAGPMDGQFLWTADGYFQKDMDKQCGNYEKIWRIMDISIYFYGYDVEIIFENMDISMDISIYFYEQNMIFFSTWMFLWQIFCERRELFDVFFPVWCLADNGDDWLWMILYLLEKMKRNFLSVLQKSHVLMFLRWSDEAMVGWFSDRKFFQNLMEEIPMFFFL